jgi:predicted Fe-Mo cluster-binding NifX family protein
MVMKIAVSALEPGLDSMVDPRFGRARWIVIYDTENERVESIDNRDNLNAVQGAGIKVAELVVEKGCQVVLTGHLGPKAFNVLKASNVKGYNNASSTVRKAIEAFKRGELDKAE